MATWNSLPGYDNWLQPPDPSEFMTCSCGLEVHADDTFTCEVCNTTVCDACWVEFDAKSYCQKHVPRCEECGSPLADHDTEDAQAHQIDGVDDWLCSWCWQAELMEDPE